MRCWIMGLVLASAAVAAHAQVYKTTDKNGHTIYSDAPKTQQSAELKLPTLNTVQGNRAAQAVPVDPPSHALAPLPTPAVNGYSVEIISPRAEASIPAGQQDLPVVVDIQPPLDPAHTLVYSLNGERLLESGSTSVVLNGVPRGSLTLQVEVLDEMGDVTEASEPRVVHMLRFPRKPQN